MISLASAAILVQAPLLFCSSVSLPRCTLLWAWAHSSCRICLLRRCQSGGFCLRRSERRHTIRRDLSSVTLNASPSCREFRLLDELRGEAQRRLQRSRQEIVQRVDTTKANANAYSTMRHWGPNRLVVFSPFLIQASRRMKQERSFAL